MKNIIISCATFMLTLAIMAASCGSDSNETEPDSFQSLVGKWQFAHFDGQFTQPNGSVKDVSWSTSEKGIELYWDFKSNGEFIAITGTETEKGRWTLNVSKTNGTTIDEGRLILSGFPEATAMVELLGTEELIFKVHTTNVSKDGKTYLSLVTEVDASKARDGLKTVFRYHYRKL